VVIDLAAGSSDFSVQEGGELLLEHLERDAGLLVEGLLRGDGLLCRLDEPRSHSSVGPELHGPYHGLFQLGANSVSPLRCM
jgi:hypothetical protein